MVCRSARLTQYLTAHVAGHWFELSIVVGLIAGAGVVTFQVATQLVSRFALDQLSGFRLEGARQ